MSKNPLRRLSAMSVCLILLLSACTSGRKAPNTQASGGGAPTWTRWSSGYKNFLEVAAQIYPQIEWELTAYAGANSTGYTWVQMRTDDIPDIFIITRTLNKDLAKKHLVDLSDV